MMFFRPNEKLDEIVKVLHEEMVKETENCLVEQLGSLTKRGLLIVEETQPVLVQSMTGVPGEFKIMKKVILKSREHEYIAKLEKELDELRLFKEQTLSERNEKQPVRHNGTSE